MSSIEKVFQSRRAIDPGHPKIRSRVSSCTRWLHGGSLLNPLSHTEQSKLAFTKAKSDEEIVSVSAYRNWLLRNKIAVYRLHIEITAQVLQIITLSLK